MVDVQFDTLSATYLLVAYQYYIILWDVDTESQMQMFDRSNNAEISSLNWLEWTAGNFAVTHVKSTTISLYNVSQKAPIQSFKLTSNVAATSSAVGTTSIANAGQAGGGGGSVTGNYTAANIGIIAAVVTNKYNYQGRQSRRVMWCCLADGSVLLYNLQRHQLEFHSSAGHTETIFACAYCPQSPDVVASVSFGK